MKGHFVWPKQLKLPNNKIRGASIPITNIFYLLLALVYFFTIMITVYIFEFTTDALKIDC
jgi:hypothetical protein